MDLSRGNMASHLLAALSLPPIRDAPPYHSENDQQTRDRPLPLEPSTSQDAYRSSQYQQSGREPNVANPQQQQQQPSARSESLGDDAPLRDDRPETHADGGPDETVESLNRSPNGPSTTENGKPAAATPQELATGSNVSTSRTYTNILPSATPTRGQAAKPKSASRQSATKASGNRRARRKWTEEETNNLIRGCHIHGVGNWKKVLDDPRFEFNGRSSVDLKDRFRTCFPKEYRKQAALESDDGSESEARNVQPSSAGDEAIATPMRPKVPQSGDSEKEKTKRKATKTELHHAEVLEKLGIDGPFKKVQRRERREFTAEEDQRLLQGFTIYGASWSRIQNDPALQLHHRRSTDLRDRFRNAFPDKYESAGFKARPRQRPKATPTSDSHESPKAAGDVSENGEDDDDDERGGSSLDGSNKGDSTAILMQSLLSGNLSPSWGNHDGAVPPADQSPAPGSLALDPALGEGFEGPSIQQMTDDFLAVAQGGTKETTQQTSGPTDIVRWEDMATHPIFELEPSMAAAGQTLAVPKKEGLQYPPIGATAPMQPNSKKRLADAPNSEDATQHKKPHIAAGGADQ